MRKLYTRKKIKLALLSLCFFVMGLSANATTYTFTGNGDWDIASNWAGNNIAPHSSGTNIIIINGNLTTSTTTAIDAGGTLTVNGTFTQNDDILVNFGNVTINNGGTLFFKKLGIVTKLHNYNIITINIGGTLNSNLAVIEESNQIIVNGSFINNGLCDGFSSITINGIMTNSKVCNSTFGQITVNNGGILNNTNTGTLGFGALTINTGGGFNNTGTIFGSGTIVNNFTNPGTIAPGNSPGLITISGGYTGTSSAIHNIEIGGTSAAQYDRINSSGNVVLGGTLNVSLINGFVPSGVHNLVIMTGNTVTGTFSTVNIPSDYSVQYNPTNVALQFGNSCVPPAIPTATLTQPTCDIATGTITVTAPTGMVSYTVTGTSPIVPPVTQAGLVFAGLTEGTYNVTASSAPGCTSAPLGVILKLDKSDWTGAVDDNWHNAGNWSTGQVPTATTHAFILTGTPTCRIRVADAHVASIQIQSGGILEILNGWQIVIHGNCVTLPPH